MPPPTPIYLSYSQAGRSLGLHYTAVADLVRRLGIPAVVPPGMKRPALDADGYERLVRALDAVGQLAHAS